MGAMNPDYAPHAYSVLMLAILGCVLVWCVGFAIYLNRIHSHGWASTRRLLRTLIVVVPVSLLLSLTFWEDFLVPIWLAAQLGRTSSQVEVARRYLTGNQLLAKDLDSARHWITRAAQSGDAQAQVILAGLDWEGRGLAHSDPESALRWARLAASRGLPPAQLLAAEILLQHPDLAQLGEAAQTYFDTAIPLLQAQAATGNANALFSLGMMKIRGHGQPIDQVGGYSLLLQAQAKGLDPYQGIMLIMLRSSLPAGVIEQAEKAQRVPNHH
jgi:TPR repeat protein